MCVLLVSVVCRLRWGTCAVMVDIMVLCVDVVVGDGVAVLWWLAVLN